MKNTIKSVKGTRDFYPEEMARRAWLYGKVREVSESFGYQEWEAPFLETLELYAAKSGEELVKEQAFVFRDRGGEQLTLRPELTPSLARMVAQRQNRLPLPVRWWSFGPFWRYERPQKGRSREFFQWNIDLLGVDSPQADAEMAAIGAELFRAAGLTPQQVCVKVNNRRLVDQKLQQFGFSAEGRPRAFRLIDRRDKLSPAGWRAFAGEMGISAAQLTSLEAMLADLELWREWPDLVAFFEALQALGVADYVEYDPTVVRGLDYYTGTVFEARDRDGEFRAIFGGGRYDNLVSDVGGQPLAATGFAMGDMVIALVLEKYGRAPALRPAPAQVLVTAFDAERQGAALSLAGELRRAGFRVEWYPEPARLQKQLKYADALGIPLAAIQGPDEIARGEVTLKNLPRREQVSVPLAEAARTLRRWLDSQEHS